MFEQKLMVLIDQHAGIRLNGKVASDRTFSARKESLLSSFRQLTTLGNLLQEPKNFSEKHVRVLVLHWLFDKKLKPKTIESHLSNLRLLAGWIGKNGMVKDKYAYCDKEHHHLLRVETAARQSKSWTGNGVNLDEIFNLADAENERLGLILRLQFAFGLRREEVLKCQPHTQDFTTHLAILKGHGKNGKPRSVPTITSAQSKILKMVKAQVGRFESLGWSHNLDGTPASLKQNLKRYANYMTKLGITKQDLGVTGHGLRAQFAENNALVHGLIPPSMGGTKGQLSKHQRKSILQILSEAMGHHRERVMSAYYCSFNSTTSETDANLLLDTIESSLALIDENNLPHLELDKRADCILIRDNLELVGLDLTLKQIHYLWSMYSHRNLVDWIKPEHGIAICLQAVSLTILNDALLQTINTGK